MSRFRRNGPLYVPSGMGKLTLPKSGSPSVPMPAYVPTSEAEVGPWVDEQLDVWNRPEVQQQIRDTRSGIEKAVVQELPFKDELVMDEDAALTQVSSYVAVNGFPTTPDEAADMTMHFLERQGEQMGFHPALLNAVDLVENWPDSPEDAAAWMQDTAANIGRQYGLPIPSDMSAKSIINSSASAVMTTAGIPGVGVVTATVDGLWDGKLEEHEVRGIVVATGAAVGAAVGQMFGIPAPVGAFVGGLVTGFIYDGLGKVFGFTDSAADRRAAAWDAMLKAKEAMESQCMDMALTAWSQYNAYWNELTANIQALLDDWGPYMGDADTGGLRYFGQVGVNVLPKKIKIPFGPTFKYLEPLPYPIVRTCSSPITGCRYFTPYGEHGGLYVREPWSKAGTDTLFSMPNVKSTGNVYAGGFLYDTRAGAKRLDAHAALAFWNAKRFVTPYHALQDMMGKGNWLSADQCYDRWGNREPCWSNQPHTDYEYLESMSHVRSALRPEDLEMCIVPRWAEHMFRSLDQVGPASKLVMEHISQTVATVDAEARIAEHIQATAMQSYREGFQASASDYASQMAANRLLTARVAQARRDLLRERRARASREAQLNAALFMGGVGTLAGWAAAEMLGRKK